MSCLSICKESGTPIFGDLIYSQNSIIYKASIHAGKINNLEGGVVLLKINVRAIDFRRSKGNYIKTLDFSYESNLTFTICKNDDKCHLDFFPNHKFYREEIILTKVAPL